MLVSGAHDQSLCPRYYARGQSAVPAVNSGPGIAGPILELQDDHGCTDQEDHIGPAAAFPRKFVLEDDVRVAEIAQLIAQHLEAMVPGALLGVASGLKRTGLVMSAESGSPAAFIHAEEIIDTAMPGARVQFVLSLGRDAPCDTMVP